MLSSRTFGRIALIVPCLLLTSCMKTPQENLVGRWFNGTNSIRFSDDGNVRWNSTRGIAQGVYVFDGSLRRTSSNTPVENLTLDLKRRGRALRPQFEAVFLGNDRLRLTPVAQENSQRVIVLKRAGDDDEETAIPLAEPSPDAQARGIDDIVNPIR